MQELIKREIIFLCCPSLLNVSLTAPSPPPPPQVLNKDAIVLEPHPHHTLLASYIGRLKLRKKWTTLTHGVTCRTLFAISGLSTFFLITVMYC